MATKKTSKKAKKTSTKKARVTKKVSPASKKTKAKKRISAKKKAVSKKTVKKTSTKKKTTAKKKSTAKKKTAAKKKAPAKKTVTKKVAAPKKKSAKKKAVTKKAAPAKKTAPKKVSPKKSVSKKAVAPSSIKTASKSAVIVKKRKSSLISFTLEDAREVLEQYRKEQATLQPSSVVVKKKTVPAKKTAKSTVKAPQRLAAASMADILGFAPNLKTGGSSKNVPKKWSKYFKQLNELKERINKELSAHAEDTIKKSTTNETKGPADAADEGTEASDRDLALSLFSSEQEVLKEINAAINRIYNNTYGVCEYSGDKISDERLSAIPYTRFSLEGKKQQEIYSRRSSFQGGIFTRSAEDAKEFIEDDSE